MNNVQDKQQSMSLQLWYRLFLSLRYVARLDIQNTLHPIEMLHRKLIMTHNHETAEGLVSSFPFTDETSTDIGVPSQPRTDWIVPKSSDLIKSKTERQRIDLIQQQHEEIEQLKQELAKRDRQNREDLEKKQREHDEALETQKREHKENLVRRGKEQKPRN
jgi:hypothetical protein